MKPEQIKAERERFEARATGQGFSLERDNTSKSGYRGVVAGLAWTYWLARAQEDAAAKAREWIEANGGSVDE